MVRRMLNHLEEMFYPVPTKIVYCCGEFEKEFDVFPPSVELIEGFPNDVNERLTKGHDNSLIMLDDLMTQ